MDLWRSMVFGGSAWSVAQEFKNTNESLRCLARNQRVAGQEAGDQVDDLRAELAELRLVLAGVVRILLSKGAVTKEEFARMIDQLDAADGQKDGRLYGGIEADGTVVAMKEPLTPDPLADLAQASEGAQPPASSDELAEAVDSTGRVTSPGAPPNSSADLPKDAFGNPRPLTAQDLDRLHQVRSKNPPDGQGG